MALLVITYKALEDDSHGVISSRRASFVYQHHQKPGKLLSLSFMAHGILACRRCPGSYPIHTEVHPMASQHAIFVEGLMPPRRCSMHVDTHKTHPRSEGNECVIFLS